MLDNVGGGAVLACGGAKEVIFEAGAVGTLTGLGVTRVGVDPIGCSRHDTVL